MISNLSSILSDLFDINIDDKIFDNTKNLDLSKDEIFDNTEDLDLSKDENYQKIVDTINELKSNKLVSLFGSFFGIDEDDLDNVLEIIKAEHEKLVTEKNKKQSAATVQKKLVDKTVEEPVRPSSKLDTQAGLQIHKLVQEYVDTMIKPYNNGALTQQQINDAYAGLYEFASWLYTK